MGGKPINMKLTNPTKNKLSIKYKGDEYSMEPESSIFVSDECATFWKEQIHQFVTLSEETVEYSAPVEVPKEVEKVEEVVEAKTAKKIKK